jgi:hypothetical protein
VSIRISPRLEAIPRYEPGLTTAEVLARYGMESAVKLASNESPFPPLPEVAAVVAAAAAGLNRYPDGPARALRRALAERHGVGPDEVVIGNGSCELILMAGQALLDPGTTIVRRPPRSRSTATWPRRQRQAVAVPSPGRERDLDAMAAAVDERTRLVIVCTPTTPRGCTARPTPSSASSRPARGPRDLIGEACSFVDRSDVGARCGWRGNGQPARDAHLRAHGLCGLRVGWHQRIGLDRRHRQVRQPFARTPSGRWRPSSLRHRFLERRVRGHGGARGWSGAGETTWAFTSQANFIWSAGFGSAPGSPVSTSSSCAWASSSRRLSLGCPALAGLHRDPGRERGIPLRACAGRPLGGSRDPTRTDADMMIVMQQGATEEQVRHVVERIQQAGARAHPSRGEFVTVIGAIGDDRQIVPRCSSRRAGVEKVIDLNPTSWSRALPGRRRGRSPGARSAAAPSASSPGPARSSRASRRWPRRAR